MREFKAAVEEVSEETEEQYVEFKLDGRVMRAYLPTAGQLAFMLAAMGRGQTKDGRTAATINIMMESLRDDDKDYFESRLLTRDPKQRLGVETISEIFEYLVEEWFARPTQPQSDSAPSPHKDGPKSKRTTTPTKS